MYYSYREAEFGSSDPHWVAHSPLELQLRGISVHSVGTCALLRTSLPTPLYAHNSNKADLTNNKRTEQLGLDLSVLTLEPGRPRDPLCIQGHWEFPISVGHVTLL